MFGHYVCAQSIRLGQIQGKLLAQSWFVYGEQQIYLNLWSVDILNISNEKVSQPDMQVGCLLWFEKLLWIFYNKCETWQEANVIVLK